METAVFTETNIGTRIAFSVPLDITTRELKRKIEREHLGHFPESGKIRVNCRSCIYYLPDFMPLKHAFQEMNQAWFVHVEISPYDAPGCSTAMAHVSDVNCFMGASKLQSMSHNTDNQKAKRKRAKMKNCYLKSTSTNPCKEKEDLSSFDHIANRVVKRCHYIDEANPVISARVSTPVLNKEERVSPMIETPSATSSEVISVGGIIERYFSGFAEASSFSGRYGSSTDGRAAQSQPIKRKKWKEDSHIANHEANPSKFATKTPPRQLSSLSSVGTSPNALMDRTVGTKVGRCLVTASQLLGLHDKSPILALYRSKSGELLNGSPQVKFSVFEISEDEDDEAD